jgi:hypothetical protein
MGTFNNQYSLHLILVIFNRLPSAWIFTELDLWNTYHLKRINENDKYKTGVQTLYCQFEFLDIPFGLPNALANRHAYFDKCLRQYVDDFTACYLVDILIYSTSVKDEMIMYGMSYTGVRSSVSISRPRSANSVSQNSVFWDLSSSPTGSAWNQTAYPQSKTGLHGCQYGVTTFCWGSRIDPDSSSGNRIGYVTPARATSEDSQIKHTEH